MCWHDYEHCVCSRTSLHKIDFSNWREQETFPIHEVRLMSENHGQPAQINPSTAYKELAPQAPIALRALINDLGYPVEEFADGHLRVATATLDLIAAELSEMVGKSPAWGWRYLQGVLNAKENASPRLTQAIYAWGAILDGRPAILTNTEEATVFAQPGRLHPGAVVLAASKRCANPKCRVAFVPVVPWQHYCQPDCRIKARSLLNV
jgi:hypothetical protein